MDGPLHLRLDLGNTIDNRFFLLLLKAVVSTFARVLIADARAGCYVCMGQWMERGRFDTCV